MGNYFADWWASGYKEILPVIPPNATISPKSNIDPASAGKAPGVRRGDGTWFGYHGWQEHPATEDNLAEWFEMGASVGLRCGEAFLLDIDAYDADTADMIEAKAIAALGPAPMRVGQWPKRALLYRADGTIPGTRLHFEQDGRQNQVEIPRQAVVYGVHARTGKPYEWPRKPKPLDQLTLVTPEKLAAFFGDLRTTLPAAKHVDALNKVDRSDVDQKTLEGDPELIAEAMRYIPNTRELFPHHNDMVNVLMALSGALPNDRGLMAELAHDFCSRWEGGDYDYDKTERKLASFKPPHSIGAGFIYRLAEKNGPFAAQLWFEQPNETPIFDLPAPQSTRKFTFTHFYDAADAALDDTGRPLIDGLLELGSMSVLYGDSNVGKTFVALDMTYHIATGLPYAGLVTTHGRVAYIAAEGGRGIKKRIAALRAARPSTAPHPDFFLLASPVDLRRPDADLKPLIEAISDLQPTIVVLDTLSRVMAGGDENSSVDMGALVKHFDALRAASAAHLMVIHHTGKDKAKGARGHSLLRAATDTEIEVTEGVVSVTKQRDLEKDWQTGFRLESVVLGVDAADRPVSSAVVVLAPVQAKETSEGGGGVIDGLEDAAVRRALELMADADWRSDHRSEAWAGGAVASAFNLNRYDPDEFARIKDILSHMRRSGLVEEVFKKDEKRRQRAFLVPKIKDNPSGSVFD